MDTVTEIREARRALRARGEVDSLRRVAAIVGCGKSTVQKYWSITTPEEAPTDVGPPPAPAAAPEPEPPAFTIENLRMLYTDRTRSPWPGGICPPLEAYQTLQTLWKECDATMALAEREARTLANMLGQQPSGSDTTGLHLLEARRSAAATMVAMIKSDMQILEMRAHDRGITL